MRLTVAERGSSDLGRYQLAALVAAIDTLGTGTGSLARLLAARVGSVLGTEASEELLRQARAMAGTPDNLTYRSGVAERSR